MAARVVDLDRLDDQRIVEIGDVRVVEGEMAVLADPDQGEIDAAVGEQAAVAGALDVGTAGGRRAAIEQLDPARPHARPDPALEPLPERALVPERQPDVLVEMEGDDPRPVDVARLGEGIEEFGLRRRRREDHACPLGARQDRAKAIRGMVRRGRAHPCPIG